MSRTNLNLESEIRKQKLAKTERKNKGNASGDSFSLLLMLEQRKCTAETSDPNGLLSVFA